MLAAGLRWSSAVEKKRIKKKFGEFKMTHQALANKVLIIFTHGIFLTGILTLAL